MTTEKFFRRHWFATLLVLLHALLVLTWAWIELDGAWNDMNPTMLVWSAFLVIDYPIHLILAPYIDNVHRTGTYLAADLALGSLYWFAIGSVLAYACRALHRLWAEVQLRHNCT
jgi:hypothetical protein